MFKKLLMVIAIGMFVSSAHAESKYVEFTISAGNKTTTVNTLIGKPIPIQQGLDEVSTECNFISSDEGASIDTKYTVDTSSGMSATFLPLERTSAGLKVYLDIRKQTSEGQKWAMINKDCKLPVGTTSSVGFSVVETFAWGKPTTLQLSDGSVVVVQAVDPQSAE